MCTVVDLFDSSSVDKLTVHERRNLLDALQKSIQQDEESGEQELIKLLGSAKDEAEKLWKQVDDEYSHYVNSAMNLRDYYRWSDHKMNKVHQEIERIFTTVHQHDVHPIEEPSAKRTCRQSGRPRHTYPKYLYCTDCDGVKPQSWSKCGRPCMDGSL